MLSKGAWRQVRRPTNQDWAPLVRQHGSPVFRAVMAALGTGRKFVALPLESRLQMLIVNAPCSTNLAARQGPARAQLAATGLAPISRAVLTFLPCRWFRMGQRPVIRHPSEIHTADPHVPAAVASRRRATPTRFPCVRSVDLLNRRIKIQKNRKHDPRPKRTLDMPAAFLPIGVVTDAA
jgi:hypothetical protein